MIASVGTDVAAIIVALALLLSAWTAFTVRKKIGTLSADLHGIKVTTDRVNQAVNNVPHGEPSLLDRVTGLHAKVDSFMAETDEWRVTVDDRLVSIEGYLTNPPPTGKRKAAA